MTVGIVRGETTGTCDVTAACPGCLGLASDKIWTVDWFTASFTLHPSLCDCQCQNVNRQLTVRCRIYFRPGLRQCLQYVTSQWGYLHLTTSGQRLLRFYFIYWTTASLHCLWILCQQFLSSTWFSATSKLERLRVRQIERVTDSLNGEVDRHSAKIYGLQEIKARRCHRQPRSRPANAALCLSG